MGAQILKPEAPLALSTIDSLGKTQAKAGASALLRVHGELQGNMSSEEKNNEEWEVYNGYERRTMERTIDMPGNDAPTNWKLK